MRGSPSLLALILGCHRAIVLGAAQSDDKGGWNEKVNDEGKVVQEMKIEAPSMTEEDQYGYNMPDRYRCDSCKAVVFHLSADLQKKHPKSRRMKQWEYTELFDQTCTHTTFEGYGIKLINGENALSGPGLKQDDTLAPGMGAIQMGGETWGKRLAEICRKIIYEYVGEEELYDKYREAGGIDDSFCSKELRECVIGAKLPPKKPEAEEKAVKKPKAKKEKSAKTKTKTTTAAPPPPASSSGPSPVPPSSTASVGERVDVQSFLRSLAVQHGQTEFDYLVARTPKEWEKLVVSMAGRIFSGGEKAEL